MSTSGNGELKWLIEYVSHLQEVHFYGKLIVEIKEGNIYLLRKEETIKPPTEKQKRA